MPFQDMQKSQYTLKALDIEDLGYQFGYLFMRYDVSCNVKTIQLVTTLNLKCL